MVGTPDHGTYEEKSLSKIEALFPTLRERRRSTEEDASDLISVTHRDSTLIARSVFAI
jgi:hypothetical protein